MRQELILKLERETQRVQKDSERAKRTLHSLKKEVDDFKVPEVMEYVYLQAQQRELTQREKILRRKIEIQHQNLQRYNHGFFPSKRITFIDSRLPKRSLQCPRAQSRDQMIHITRNDNTRPCLLNQRKCIRESEYIQADIKQGCA